MTTRQEAAETLRATVRRGGGRAARFGGGGGGGRRGGRGRGGGGVQAGARAGHSGHGVDAGRGAEQGDLELPGGDVTCAGGHPGGSGRARHGAPRRGGGGAKGIAEGSAGPQPEGWGMRVPGGGQDARPTRTGRRF